MGLSLRCARRADRRRLGRIIHIRNEGHTVLEAINRQLAHYPYHVGQIVHIGKLLRGTIGRASPSRAAAPRPSTRTSSASRNIAVISPTGCSRTRTPHRCWWKSCAPRTRVWGPWWTPQQRSAPRQVERRPAHAAHPPGREGHGQLPRDAEGGDRGVRPHGGMDMGALRTSTRTARAGRGARRTVSCRSWWARRKRGLIAEGRAEALMSRVELGRGRARWLMCPHPAMGPLTAREMVMFTVLHARHHTRSVERISR